MAFQRVLFSHLYVNQVSAVFAILEATCQDELLNFQEKCNCVSAVEL